MKKAFEELKKDFKEAVSEIDFQKYDPYSRTFMKPLFIGQLMVAMKCFMDDDPVGEELDGAEEYIEKYLASGDSTYKEMAADELRHAGILMKKTGDEHPAHEAKRQELLKMISSRVEER